MVVIPHFGKLLTCALYSNKVALGWALCMNFLSCYSMAVWLNTGRTFSWLHSLPLLAISAVIVSQLWTNAMKGLRINFAKWTSASATTRSALRKWRRWRRSVSAVGISSVWSAEEEAANITRQLQEHIYRKPEQRGFSRLWGELLVFLLVGSWIGWISLAVLDGQKISRLETELSRYRTQTVTEHNVAVIRKLGDGDFAFQSDEEPQGGAYRPCHVDYENGLDVTGMLSQAVGYIADRAAWEERGVCKSILRADLGFWWRDKNNNFKFKGKN